MSASTTSAAFRCAGTSWHLRSDRPDLVAEVRRLYEACPGAPHEPPHSVLTLRSLRAGSDEVAVDRDGEVVVGRASPALARARVVWEVNRIVTRPSVRHQLLLHAAAAADGTRAVVLAGASGSGKSTLVAALARAGLSYLTDEVVVLPLDGGPLQPYPKPLGLGAGALAALGPGLATLEGVVTAPDGWLVAPSALRPGSDSTSAAASPAAPPAAVPRIVVLPRYAPGSTLDLTPLTRAEAAVELVRSAFNFRDLGRGRLELLAGMLRRCDCYRVRFGDLGTARDAILDLVSVTTTAVRS